MNRYDAVVVGAGPAGSSLSVRLARAGARVALIDRANFPRSKPCAEFLSPECSRHLEDLDVLERCEESGAALLRGMLVRAPDGTLIHGIYDQVGAHRPHRPAALSMRREVLDTILVKGAEAAGASVLQRLRVTDMLRAASGRVTGVRVLAGGGNVREIQGGVVIGADGLRSVVAGRLRLRRRSRLPQRLALVGHWRGLTGTAECGEMHVERDGYFGLAHVGEGVSNISMVVPAGRAREISRGPAAFYEAWLRKRTQLAPRLATASRTGAVMVTGPFATRCTRAWVPGAALVGDAADYFDPFTGEGIFSALQGAAMLAPRLLAGLDASSPRRLDELLADYDRSRRAEMAPKRTVERAIALFVSAPALMNHAAAALSSRQDLASLLVGVCGDFVPPRTVLDPRYILRLLAAPFFRSGTDAAAPPRHASAVRTGDP